MLTSNIPRYKALSRPAVAVFFFVIFLIKFIACQRNC